MDISDLIFAELRRRDISLRDFAELTGIDHSTLSVIRNRKSQASTRTIKKLVPFLGRTEDELLVMAGHRSATQAPGRLQPTLPIAIPVYDQPVSAGRGEPAIQEYLYLPPDSTVRADWYGLPVHGDCMVPVLLDGDVVVVDPSAIAEPGDMVVADIDHEQAMVKWFVKHGKGYFLEPEQGERIPFDEEHIRIVGVVVRMWRDIRKRPRRAMRV